MKMDECGIMRNIEIAKSAIRNPQSAIRNREWLFFVLLVRGFARREVIDIGRQILVHRVDIVEGERAARGLHRNRTARPFLILLFAALLTAARRLCIGTEVATACGRPGSGSGIEWPRSAETAAGTGTTETRARAGRSRPAESARAWPAEPAWPRPARTAILARPRLAHRQRAAVEHLPVEPLNG